MAGLRISFFTILVVSNVFAELHDSELQFYPPPYNHQYSTTINQNDVAGSPIFTAVCTAPVHNATLDDRLLNITYGTLTNNTFVTINSTTGTVSLMIDARDLPGGRPFTSILYCKYADIDSSIATVELRVRYMIENVYVPVFTHGDQALDLWVQEDHFARQGSIIVRLNVTDEDLEPCNSVTFAILSGNSDGSFRVGSDDGVLELTKNLNYDYSHRRYNLTIQATNTECGDRRYADQTIVYIYVMDVDDEHPTFEQHTYTFTFNELQQPRNFVQLRCLDPDTAGAQIVYDENFLSGENPFVIHHRTGNVSAVQPLDYELRTSYHLTFTCYNILNTDIQDTAVIRVLVNPINEYLPELRESFAYIPFNYASPVGTLLASAVNGSRAIFSITATDRDHGEEHGNIQFKFAERNDYYKYFQLDPQSGDLTLIKQFDFDVCSENAQHIRVNIPLRIIVCDTLKDEYRLQFCPTIAIFVAISSPSCSLTFLWQNYTVDVPESTEIGSELIEINCAVPGRRNNTALHDQQVITTFSPDRKFSRTLRIEGDHVILQEMLDYESIHQFTIYLRCSSADGQESIASLLIHVLPENDNPPYFQESLYTFRVSAEQIEILPVFIGRVTATDNDQGDFNNLTYHLVRNQNFDSMNDWSTYFTLNMSENGTVSISMVNPPIQDITVFDIVVSDGINSARSSILVYITDETIKTAISCTVNAERCGVFCIVLLIILFIFMLVFIAALAVCICYSRRLKQKYALSSAMELQMSKSNMMQQYSSLQRKDIQPKSRTTVEAGHLLYVGPKVAACPAYLQSNNSRESHGEDDAEYHYIPSENVELHHRTDPSARSAAPYQEPVVLSTMEMEDYIKMQETTQPSRNSLANTVPSISPISPVVVRCCSETDIIKKGPSVAAVEQGQLPLSFGVSNHSVENIYEHIQ